MRLPENNFVEVDFDKRVKIEKLANKNIKIVKFGTMTTKFGKKSFALLDNDKWFYLTESLDFLTECELPLKTKIYSKESKSGNTYWTTDDKYENSTTRIHITELEGREIEIHNMRLVDTKYGERIGIDFFFLEDDNDTYYTTLTRWNSLYDYVCDQTNGDPSLLFDDPIQLKVILKQSKNSDNKYFGYTNIDERF